jgi:hypothetical protein
VVIEAHGATRLVETAGRFYLHDGAGSGPSLKYGGADYTTGQFGAWAPIGAEQTADGYQVVWKVTGADQYTVWNTNGQGNLVSYATGVVSGSDPFLQGLESSYSQDLNGNGQIGASASTAFLYSAIEPDAFVFLGDAPSSAVDFIDLHQGDADGVHAFSGDAGVMDLGGGVPSGAIPDDEALTSQVNVSELSSVGPTDLYL